MASHQGEPLCSQAISFGVGQGLDPLCVVLELGLVEQVTPPRRPPRACGRSPG